MNNERKQNITNLKIFTGIVAVGTLVSSVALYHNTFSGELNNPSDNLCPVAKYYYSNGEKEKCYDHQIKHIEKYFDGNVACEYIKEEYTAPVGYDLDGEIAYKQAELVPEVVIVNGKKETYYIPPEGYRIKNGMAIKTIEANHQYEGIKVVNNETLEETFYSYDEAKKLVK